MKTRLVKWFNRQTSGELDKGSDKQTTISQTTSTQVVPATANSSSMLLMMVQAQEPKKTAVNPQQASYCCTMIKPPAAATKDNRTILPFVSIKTPSNSMALSTTSDYEMQLQRLSTALTSYPLSQLAAARPKKANIPCYQAKKTAPGCLQTPLLPPLYVLKYNCGQGTFGKVNLALHQQQLFAVKKFKRFDTTKLPSTIHHTMPGHLDEAMRETVNMRLANSTLTPPSIYYTNKKAYMLEPLMLGSLQQFVGKATRGSIDPISGNEAAGMAICMLAAVTPSLQTLHHTNFAHLDIKPGNILYRGDTIVLADYGFMQHYQTQKKATTFLAPEHLSDKRPINCQDARQIDIWCLGISSLALASKQFANTYYAILKGPQDHQVQFFQAYRHAHQLIQQSNPTSQATHGNWLVGEIYDMFQAVSQGIKPLLLAMCHPEPNKRPVIDNIANIIPILSPPYQSSIVLAKQSLQHSSILQLEKFSTVSLPIAQPTNHPTG